MLLFFLLSRYVATVFELPEDAQDKHMQVQNLTLTGLPQLPIADGSNAAVRQPGRMLRQTGTTGTPPGIWACLLWPWRRCEGVSH